MTKLDFSGDFEQIFGLFSELVSLIDLIFSLLALSAFSHKFY